MTQAQVAELAAGPGPLIVCGRFEGVDQRVIEGRNLHEVSIGDYVLTVENAIFLVALGITSGMPLVVELGIFFDVILAVLVLGVLVRRIVDRFESMDVSRLSKLKG